MSAPELVRGPGGSGLLPVPTTALVGRADLVDTVLDIMSVRRARLITLVGLGGVGKTRLAIEVAQRARDRFPDDAAFLDLAPITDAARVPDELCRQLGIASFLGEDSMHRLGATLARRNQLLVVDNVEQVVEAGRFLAELVRGCPGIVLLVTSRRRLRVAAESVVPVPPLALDAGEGEVSSPAAAVELYTDRARAVDPSFGADADTLHDIAEICRLLDGLPLAIELAAARSRTVQPRQVLTRLRTEAGDPWSVLASAPVDASRRHYGLLEAISWSLELLEPPDVVLFERLGVFRGGFSLEAVEQVCAGRFEGPVDLEENQILDGLSTLVDLHLVEPIPVPDVDGAQRFRLLETIAVTARHRLRAHGDEAAVRGRHSEFHLGLLLAAGAGLEGPDEATWYRRIAADTANLQATLEELHDRRRGDDLSRAVAALGPYWLNCGRFAAGRRWLSTVLEHYADSSRDAVLACRGWSARLALDGRAGSLTAAESAELIAELESVAGAAAELADPRRWLRAVDHLTYAHRLYGDPVRGRQLCEEALDRCDTGDDGGAGDVAWWRAELLLRLALLYEQLGDGEQSRQAARRAVAAAARGGNERARARAIQAEVLGDQGLDPLQLRRRLAEVLETSETFGDRRGAVTTRLLLASFAAGDGDLAACGRAVLAAVADSVQIGYEHGIGLAGITLAFQAGAANDHAGVAEVHAAIARQLPSLCRQIPIHLAAHYDRLITRTRGQLGTARFDEALALARDATPARSAEIMTARAQRLARTSSNVVAPIRAARPRGVQIAPEPLSQRQLQVLGLIADGMTNEQIAERLMLSPKTVMHHSGHIYRKLGVRGRAEAVASASRLGLLRV